MHMHVRLWGMHWALRVAVLFRVSGSVGVLLAHVCAGQPARVPAGQPAEAAPGGVQIQNDDQRAGQGGDLPTRTSGKWP